MRPELGGGSSCCSWQVGWGPAELTTHRPGAAALRPRGSRRRGHALIRSLRRSSLNFLRRIILNSLTVHRSSFFKGPKMGALH
ncbi:cAMP-dependent protein kinase inhibitor alpha isoform X1 [Balaenoptera acutorostrata]|uniref:cAMP-dependent protein kinase inhibitor alpha isoform X1 n=1 Tax=Balaenoptera acutorostrata TaxID=9767 RepID=A0ABM3SEL1_BALAC|nr:cAMP-dependent protein kinase inhibitor alpha isoform X1 [Balaenoptera acutorostrata]